MDALQIFPHLNASLNALSSAFLVSGLFFILKKNVRRHRFCMISASVVSALFLVCYISYHTIRTLSYGLGPTKFAGEGIARPIYLTILTSHTILATLVGPFVIATLWRGLKMRVESHRKLARLVYPVWLYVSVTGVIVYLMLYQLYPAK